MNLLDLFGIAPHKEPAHTIVDQVIRSRRRTLCIQINSKGRVIVRAPLKIAQKVINEFISNKQTWIETTRKRILTEARVSLQPEFVEGGRFLFFGESYPLLVADYETRHVQFNQGKFFIDGRKLSRAREEMEKWYRQQALDYCEMRTRELAAVMGVAIERVRVSGARKRWGSCSGNGTISFAWRIIMAPKNIIDAVIIHELAHVSIRNHSRRFWQCVEKWDPDFKSARKWLRVNHHLLDW